MSYLLHTLIFQGLQRKKLNVSYTIVKIEKVYTFTCQFDGGNIAANTAARTHRAHHLPSCIPASGQCRLPPVGRSIQNGGPLAARNINSG